MADARAIGNVRDPVWRGVQDVAGLWFASDWLGGDERIARMIAAWQPGARAYRFASGDLLRYSAPRPMACETASGQPLCMLRGALYSAPLTDSELAALPPCEIGLVSGGRVVALSTDQAVLLDLSEWIDVGAYALHDAYDCRLAPPSLQLPQLDGTDVRELLGDAIPAQSDDSRAFLRELRQVGSGRGVGERVRGGVARLVGGVAGMLARVGAPAAQGGGSGWLAPRRTPQPPSRWRAALQRFALASGVGRVLGWRQGAYLQRMMAMFERGDLFEALRNALPLGGLGDEAGASFGVPGRRDRLELSHGGGRAVQIGVDSGLQDYLRQLYRRAFEQLDRAGRVDEAVFVLAELLNARQEALDYLGKHGRHAQAAELALAWDMPSPTIIRLLMQAGDARRAVQVARRDNAFAEAVRALEPQHRALADALRLEWGHALLQAGERLAAVDAVWPLRHARELASQWLLAAEQAGTELSARALVQRAALLPDTVAHHAERIARWADPSIADDRRTALAKALLSVREQTDAVRALAAHVLPAIAADRALGRNELPAKQLDALLQLAGDPLLKADLPSWSTPPAAPAAALWQRTAPLELVAPAAGLQRIEDAARLPGGRCLVAFGEGGAAVVDAYGRIVQRYAVPASKLVIAASGHVALALAQRERLTRIARLDLVDHAIADLGTMTLQFAATGFDGVGWTVVVDDRIVVIDTGSAGRDVLWHVGDLPGPIVAARFFLDRELYLIRAPDRLQDWSYALPSRRRISRETPVVEQGRPAMLHPLASVLQPEVQIDGGRVELAYMLGTRPRRCVLSTAAPAEFHCTFAAVEEGLVVGVHAPDGSRYYAVALERAHVVAVVEWPAGTLANVRSQRGHLLFHDEAGRVLDVDVDRSTVRHVSVV